MYKVSAAMFPELEKRIKYISKKLDKYSLLYEFKTFDPIVEMVSVYVIDGATQIKVGEKLVEVIPYTFWMENLQIADWVPIARIEHGAIYDTSVSRKVNMVHPVHGSGLAIDESFWNIDSKCEHCNSNRRRKTTIMLQHNGKVMQVGSTCIKEFTGIDALDIIALYTSIQDVILDEAYEIAKPSGTYEPSKYRDIDMYLAGCIRSIKLEGYIKDHTKYQAVKLLDSNLITQDDINEAREQIDFWCNFNINLSYDQGFYLNIKTAIGNEFTQVNGLLAYSPVAYQKVQESIQVERDRIEAKANQKHSQWQGEVGQKISVEVTLLRSITYDSQWGLGFFHLFIDNDGNIYKWSTGTSLMDKKVDGVLTGTIKGHDEYDGVEQTLITRCKIS